MLAQALAHFRHVAGLVSMAVAGCGLVTVSAGAIAVRRFAASPRPAPRARPPVSVLRPLCGAEPMLEEALASMCRQAYPAFQIVLGVQDAADPALAVVARVQASFPAIDIVVIVDRASSGANRKIGNLMNMLPAARHDLLVFCDSDLHVAPDYLDRIVAGLETAGTGLVTTICAGLPVVRGLAARLGASTISHCFVPGALLSRALGRQDCLGTTMALQRETLEAIGGLGVIRDTLADDNVLGQLVRRQGMGIALARTVPGTAVTETGFAALWQHELRWARTIRKLEPVLYAASAIHYPLFWAALAVLLQPGASTVGMLGGAWALRGCAAWWVDAALQPGRRRTFALLALLPLRDTLSVAQIMASFLGARVVWRGRVMRADAGLPVTVG